MSCMWGLGSCNLGFCRMYRFPDIIGFHQPAFAWELLPGVVYILSGDCGVGGGTESVSGREKLRKKFFAMFSDCT